MIDWKRKCDEIYNFIKVLTVPYPCAFTIFEDHMIKIIRCKYIEVRSNLLDNYICGGIVKLIDSESFW